jgi:hypothetical protein
MTMTGIRELKDNLSHYVRRTEAGERIAVTAHAPASLDRRWNRAIRWRIGPICGFRRAPPPT